METEINGTWLAPPSAQLVSGLTPR